MPRRSSQARDVKLTNQEKVFFPKAGFTKGDMVDYYRAVAPHILPHLRNRPVTLVRFPDGVDGKSFYAKNAPSFTPDWVARHEVPRRHSEGKIEYILINNVATLVWCANLAAIELHPFLHRASHLDRPTSIAFDFDPGQGSDLLTCIEAALLVKEVLDDLGLQSLPKVTGSKGLQVFVPLNTAVNYEATGGFAHAVAQLLEERHPGLIVSTMSKAARRKRVMIDWSQNNAAKTTVCVYSMRAKRDEPFISMPVDWSELKSVGKSGKLEKLYFGPREALARLKKRGDLFAPVLKLKQRLPPAFGQDDKPAGRKRSGTNRSQSAGNQSRRGSLQSYAEKRDFQRTGEPPARTSRSRTRGRKRKDRKSQRFVVQKHDARNLHYDFRLEHDGVLKSWAVPKGIPYRMHVKRSAFATEDHPIDYLEFEGTIPPGQYGGGTVMVWDLGTYELLSGDPDQGSMRLRLDGKKLKGEWRMYRIREEDGKATWLMEKGGRSMRAIGRRRDDESVLTRRSMTRIARDNDAQWQSAD